MYIGLLTVRPCFVMVFFAGEGRGGRVRGGEGSVELFEIGNVLLGRCGGMPPSENRTALSGFRQLS